MEASISLTQFFEDRIDENQVNVFLINEDTNEKNIYRYYSPDFSDQTDFCLYGLLATLKEEGNPIENCMIFWLDYETKNYIFVGNDPIPQELHICFSPRILKKIAIKYRKPYISNIVIEALNDQNNKVIPLNETLETKGRRAKERRIGEVIEKVALWRRLFSGISIEDQNIQMDLESSASQVGLSKKTLDDYLTQIRLGKRHGFDFNVHAKEKVGLLRKFNRFMRNATD